MKISKKTKSLPKNSLENRVPQTSDDFFLLFQFFRFPSKGKYLHFWFPVKAEFPVESLSDYCNNYYAIEHFRLLVP